MIHSLSNNLSKFVFDRVRNNQTAGYIFGDHVLLYRDLESFSRKTAGYFDHRGIGVESTVIINLPDSHEWPVIFYALTLIGARIMVTHANLDITSLHAISARINATHMISNRDRDIGTTNIMLDDVTQHRSDFEYQHAHQYHPDDLHFMITTSGTSGRQKIVEHRHNAAIKLIEHFDGRHTLYKDINHESVIMCTAKMNFLYGLGANICLAPSQGVTSVIFDRKLTPRNIITLVNKHRVTHLFSGAVAYMLLTKYRGKMTFGDSIQCLVSGGEKLPETIAVAFGKKFSLDIYDAIGASEVFWFFIGQHRDAVRPGSMGKLLPHHEAKVVNQDGSDCAVGEVGRLMVKADWLALGYYDDPASNEFSFRDGWFWTNDLVRIDDQGFYTYVGRSGQLHKVHGIWVNLLEVENYICVLPEVTDCLAEFTVDVDGLIEVKASIVTTTSLSAEDIRKKLVKVVPPCQMPKFVTMVPEIPRTLNGKKIRHLEIQSS